MKQLNIHTHHYDAQSDAIQVLSLEALDFLSLPYPGVSVGAESSLKNLGEASPAAVRSAFENYAAGFPSNVYFSVGIHPWKAASVEARSLLDDSGAFTQASFEAFRSLLQHPRVVLMGEIGLDKLCDAPYEQQLILFQQQLRLAAALRKPVILHVVKAMDDVLALHKRFASDIPVWIIHGFRGNAQQAQQYLRHGFHLSFGPHHQAAALNACPPDRRFFETD